MKKKKEKEKNFKRGVHWNALEEYTDLIKFISKLENKNAGRTGFMYFAEERIKEEFDKFVHGERNEYLS